MGKKDRELKIIARELRVIRFTLHIYADVNDTVKRKIITTI